MKFNVTIERHFKEPLASGASLDINYCSFYTETIDEGCRSLQEIAKWKMEDDSVKAVLLRANVNMDKEGVKASVCLSFEMIRQSE